MKNSFLNTLKKNIETVLSHEIDTTLADIDKRLEDLQTELLKLANSKANYEDVADEIYHLREQPYVIVEYDEPLVRRLIKKFTVYEDKFTVEFKSGMTVDMDE